MSADIEAPDQLLTVEEVAALARASAVA